MSLLCLPIPPIRHILAVDNPQLPKGENIITNFVEIKSAEIIITNILRFVKKFGSFY